MLLFQMFQSSSRVLVLHLVRAIGAKPPRQMSRPGSPSAKKHNLLLNDIHPELSNSIESGKPSLYKPSFQCVLRFTQCIIVILDVHAVAAAAAGHNDRTQLKATTSVQYCMERGRGEGNVTRS